MPRNGIDVKRFEKVKDKELAACGSVLFSLFLAVLRGLTVCGGLTYTGSAQTGHSWFCPVLDSVFIR